VSFVGRIKINNMATQKKNTVDYFPHMIGDGKKMDFIEKRYGNDGYATWFKLLEALARTDNHYLNLNDEIEISFLASRCNVEEEVLISIINDLVKIKVFDAELWKHRVIWSQIFVDSIQDAYKRRANKCMQHADIIKELNTQGFNLTPIMHATCIHDVNKTSKNDDKNPQSKLNKSIEDKSRVEEEEKEENFDVVNDDNSSNSNIPKPNSWGVYSSMEDLETVLLSHQSWQADFGKSLGINNPQDVPKWISKFFSFCKGSGKFHEKESEAKSHCHAWTRRQIELGKNPESSVIAISQNGSDGEKPLQEGISSGELAGKWIWLNNGWRDTTTFTDHQKRKHGLK